MNQICEHLGIQGLITASMFDMRSPKAVRLERAIQHALRHGDQLTYRELLAELAWYFKVRQHQTHNLIATVGRSALAGRLANITAYTGIINYGALGTGSTAAANGDTQLQTEVYRKTTASTSQTNNIAFIDFFYAKADTNGTYNEFATFIDGTGSANTGQLFTRALTGGWVKTSSESMTVAVQYTLS